MYLGRAGHAICNIEMNALQMYKYVKDTGVPNFLGARVPVKSQLNVNMSEEVLCVYWVELI